MICDHVVREDFPIYLQYSLCFGKVFEYVACNLELFQGLRTMRVGRRIKVTPSKLRSALTNGRDVLAEIDGRTAIARRYRDLIELHTSDLGGADHLSEGQHALVRRVATMTVQLELLESRFAQDGGAGGKDFELYQRGANTLRRLLETLGTTKGRKARPINEPHDLNDYLRSRSNGRFRTIDGEVN